MRKNRLIAIIVVMLLALVSVFVTACAGDGENTSQPQTPGTQTEQGDEPTSGLWYTYDEDTDSYLVSAGNATYERRIVIPDTYNGKPVTTIPSRAFENCSVKSIVLPSSITEIGEEAFNNCAITGVYITDLAAWCNIDFEDSTSNPLYRGEGDLYINGEKQTALVIPRGTKEIKTNAFAGCARITSVTIPASVTSIGADTFSGCSNLESISVDPGNIAYSSLDGILYNSATTEFILIPQAIKGAVKIADGITVIGSNAFEERSGLTEITIPASVTSIGDEAFFGCADLQTVNWNATNCTEAGQYYVSDKYPYDPTDLTIFKNCKSLTAVNIGANVEIIPACAFNGCSGLTEIEIPASVTSIGNLAFEWCLGLSKINITDLAAWCNIDFGDYEANPLHGGANLYINDELQEEIIIPQEITEIKNYTFYFCSSITDVTIHEGVGSIGYDAFYACCGLTSITIPASVTSIGNEAFSGCPNLHTVTFDGDSRLETIGSEAFYDCRKLASIAIPASVTSIGKNAFKFCEKLIEVCNNSTLPIIAGTDTYGYVAYYAKNVYSSKDGNSKLTNHDDYLFYEDSEKDEYYLVRYMGDQTELSLPDIGHDYEISDYALCGNIFRICEIISYKSNIVKISIPASVTSIGKNAFEHCTNLQTVTFDGESKLGSIGWCAFNGCSNLTEITIPASVTSIGMYAFEYCYNLQTVTFDGESKLETIGHGVFQRCWNLTEITIPARVTSIGGYAFDGCTKLQTVTFASDGQLGTIGSGVFQGCRNLTEIEIPASVTSIGIYAFSGCVGLQKVTFEEPNGWKVSKYSDMSYYPTSLSSEELENSATAAKYLRESSSDSGYSKYYWKRG